MYQLIRAVETKNDAVQAKEDTEYLLEMDELVAALQVSYILGYMFLLIAIDINMYICIDYSY